MQIVVEEENERLDKYLAKCVEYSRSTLEKMINEGYVLVNGKNERTSFKLKTGDIIDIKDGFIKKTDLAAEKMDLDIVYEDDYLLVVNKPSGLVVHPGSGNYSNTLVNGLLYYTNDLSDNDDNRPGIVHRIDKDTSGLLLIAKDNKTHELLGEYFKNKKVEREYIALICGSFPHESAIIDAPIGRDPKDRKKMAVTPNNSKNAITHLKVLKRYKKYTLVSLKLETGRTHQIRVHLKYIGYPVYNDPVYTSSNCTSFGQFLHSYKMSFIHPITKKKIELSCPLPKYFQDFIDLLDKDQE